MVPCFNGSSHPLLSADELALETRPGDKDELSTAAQRPHTAAGELEVPLLEISGRKSCFGACLGAMKDPELLLSEEGTLQSVLRDRIQE